VKISSQRSLGFALLTLDVAAYLDADGGHSTGYTIGGGGGSGDAGNGTAPTGAAPTSTSA
jgi:hypothetical protein